MSQISISYRWGGTGVVDVRTSGEVQAQSSSHPRGGPSRSGCGVAFHISLARAFRTCSKIFLPELHEDGMATLLWPSHVQ